jgi:carboxyl-terminal processing protease
VKFLDASDRVTKLELIRRPIPGEPVKIGDLPTAFAQFVGEQRDAPDGRIRAGYIWFNAWLVPLVRQFDLAMDDFRELDGIVVDLRGNTGGVGAMILGLAGHFLDDRGPVAVLTDGLSASASEVFAGGMQAVGRVRVFGGITAGAVLPARMDRLPNGDVLYHAFGEFETTTGLRLEGRGVFPDRPVSVTREDLLTGRDAVLTAALDWIAAERGRIARSHSADDDREF